MQSKTPVVVGAFVLGVLIVLGIYLSLRPHQVVAPVQTTTTEASGNATVGATGQSQIISYTDSGFSPASVSISEGTTVTWSNTSSHQMWVASGNHPDHTKYDSTPTNQHCVNNAATSGTVFDECTAIASGGSYSFTFTKSGSWSYHNHVRASDMGTIIVTASQSAAAAGPINVNSIPN